MKLERVTWLDHTTFTDNIWRSEAEIGELEPVTFETVGWVLKETKRSITLVSTRALSYDNFTGEMVIVKKAITKRETIDEDSA